MKFYVQIIKYDTREVVENIECGSEREAEQVERGVNINLNHADYFTHIKGVEASE